MAAGAALPVEAKVRRRYDVTIALICITLASTLLIDQFTATDLRIPLRVLDLVHLPRLKGLYEADLVLVRPDQHVAWRGSAVPDAGALLRSVVGAADDADVVDPTPAPLEEISR